VCVTAYFRSFQRSRDLAGAAVGLGVGVESVRSYVRPFGVCFFQHKYFYVFVIGNSKNALNPLWAPQEFLRFTGPFHLSKLIQIYLN
jgi:hypothetical protein